MQKLPVTIKSNGVFDNKTIQLNAKTVEEAKNLFNSKFVFDHRMTIFAGDFVTNIAANKTYKNDGTLNDQALTFDGKITGIAKKLNLIQNINKVKNQEFKFISDNFFKNILKQNIFLPMFYHWFFV